MQFEDMKVLVVERFDRRWWGDPQNKIIRLPQEDMCQATGTSPLRKYEADGGPGIDAMMTLLDGSHNREQDKLTFYQAQVRFWMLCATDGHAKNFSIYLQPQDTYVLTPLYDVFSAYPLLGAGPGKLSPHKAKMAMAIRSKNAHYKMREIQRRHLEVVGERHGVVTGDGKAARCIIDQLVARKPDVIELVTLQSPSDFPARVADSILGEL